MLTGEDNHIITRPILPSALYCKANQGFTLFSFTNFLHLQTLILLTDGIYPINFIMLVHRNLNTSFNISFTDLKVYPHIVESLMWIVNPIWVSLLFILVLVDKLSIEGRILKLFNVATMVNYFYFNSLLFCFAFDFE